MILTVQFQQAFLLQQRLTDIKHPDHTLITYPNLGHVFYPSSQWLTGIGPIQQYVLADIYAWLETHSGLSHSYTTTSTASALGANSFSIHAWFCKRFNHIYQWNVGIFFKRLSKS